MRELILSKKGKILEFLVATIFIFIGAVFRLLPHPPNFTPISAIALFGGVYFSNKLSLTLPVLAMLISDIFLGFYQPSLMLSVYGSFILCVILGFWLKKHKKWHTVLAGSIFCSILFFIITNFAVWAFTLWYPKTIGGFIECYALALPFFKNSLLGDLFYVAIFFGIYEAVEVWIKRKFTICKPILIPK